MSRIFNNSLRLLGALLIVAPLWLVSTPDDTFAAGDKSIALTLKVTGDVNIRKAGTNKAIPLTFGTVLDNGDWVKTGADGFATLIFTDDKSQIKLTANTEIVIEGKRDDQSNITKRVSMEVGQLFAKVEQQRGVLQIATPTSVASVKGTEFWVIVFDDGTTQVITLEGLVELLNTQSGRVVEVYPGRQGESNPDGTIEVGELPPGEIPPDPDPGMGPPQNIEIEIQDADGNIRRITIQYQENQ